MKIGNATMMLRVQNRLASVNNRVVGQSEKLASGIRINRASDDAAGLKISEKMRSQIRGLDMSINNATDGISMIQTAEGGLSAITDLLQRMNELSVKAQNGTYTENDLNNISIEYEQCKREIDRIAETTTFNGRQLLNINTGETKMIKGASRVGTSGRPASVRVKVDFSTVGDGNEFIVKKGDQEYRFEFSYNQTGTGVSGAGKVELTGKETNREKAEKLAAEIKSVIGDVEVDVFGNTPEDGKQYSLTIFSTTPVAGEKIKVDMANHAPVIKIGNKADDSVFINLKSVTTADLRIDETSVLTPDQAQEATAKIATALDMVNEQRSMFGATQNRIEYAIKRVTVEMENTQAAESRIRDINMAKQMVTYAKDQIIQRTAISMLAQANQENGNVLRLLSNR